MSRLEELIQELCPDGVEYKEIGEFTQYEQPSKYIVASTNYDDSYSIPVLTAGQTFVLGYTNETDGIYEASQTCPAIIFDDFTAAFKWVDFPFKVKSSAVKIITVNEEVTSIRYLYHMMGVINYLSDEHKRLWISKYSKIKIPVPPLLIQEEIVRILDKFTDYVTELQAELQARKQQYEYYRELLLSNNGDIPHIELRQVIKKSYSGGTPKKTNKLFYENGTIPWIRTQDVKFNNITSVNSFITEEAVAKTSVKWIPENCIIIAISGASAGRCAINKIRATTNQHCLNLEINEKKALYKYVYYCVRSQYQELLNRKQGARGDLNSSLILGITIPLPELQEQERIVKLLEKFEGICNDISSGLPAEIEARQKQYEYYRDKLLSFKEKE